MATWADAVELSAGMVGSSSSEAGEGGSVPGLLEWIPLVSPEFARPAHMGPVAEVFGRALGCLRGDGSVVREMVSWPIRPPS